MKNFGLIKRINLLKILIETVIVYVFNFSIGVII